MKKFQVIYVDSSEDVRRFKVLANDKKHAAAIFRKVVSRDAHIVNVIAVNDKPRHSWGEVNIVVACAICFILLITLACTCCSWGEPTPVEYEKYVVQSGDTLWEIGMLSNGWNHFDNSYIINHIQERSDCSSLIYPGQVVYIPVYEVQ